MKIPDINAKIVVAISFDSHVEGLIKTTIDLFHNSNADITLVHVVTPKIDRIISSLLTNEIADFSDIIASEQRETAYYRLQRLASTMQRSIEVKTEVLTGNVAEALSNYAQQHKIDVVILGTSKNRTLTTAADLVAKETVPILIIHEDSHLIDFASNHRIAIGDDLQQGGRAAVSWGFKLSEILGGAAILHVHISSIQEFAHQLNDMAEGSLDRTDTATTISRLKKKQSIKLKERFSQFTGVAEDQFNGLYENEASVGNVVEELERSSISVRADISVFSLHKIYHRGYKESGHVPFKKMVDNDRLVMIVPPAKSGNGPI